MANHPSPPPRSSADGSNGRVSPTTGAHTPISQSRKGAIEVTADEATLSPQQERFMKRKRAIESAEAELLPPKSHHITMTSLVEPATTKIATMPNAIPASSVAGQTTKPLQLEEVARIARDILAIPASVVPSESAFSTGSRVVSDYRSRLDSKTVEALICLQDWFTHYDSLAAIVDGNDL